MIAELKAGARMHDGLDGGQALGGYDSNPPGGLEPKRGMGVAPVAVTRYKRTPHEILLTNRRALVGASPNDERVAGPEQFLR